MNCVLRFFLGMIYFALFFTLFYLCLWPITMSFIGLMMCAVVAGLGTSYLLGHNRCQACACRGCAYKKD